MLCRLSPVHAGKAARPVRARPRRRRAEAVSVPPTVSIRSRSWKTARSEDGGAGRGRKKTGGLVRGHTPTGTGARDAGAQTDRQTDRHWRGTGRGRAGRVAEGEAHAPPQVWWAAGWAGRLAVTGRACRAAAGGGNWSPPLLSCPAHECPAGTDSLLLAGTTAPTGGRGRRGSAPGGMETPLSCPGSLHRTPASLPPARPAPRGPHLHRLRENRKAR